MSDLKSIFEEQRKYSFQLRLSDYKERISFLRRLKKVIYAHEDDILVALQSDLAKNAFEASVTELFFVYAEIDFAIKHLSQWMKPQKVKSNWVNFFAKSRIHKEPKGVCLILAPWNYPFQLVMSPLVSAIAAGNTAIVKPSEVSVASSSVVKKIISQCFQANHVVCIEGGKELSTQLLELPFDHIFYTGGTAVGKIVMAAAAKNLSSVSLELGGKSPVIIDSTADLADAAQKIAWGKLVNAGQTCIAPDYLFINKAQQDEFIGHYKKAVQQLFYNSRGDISHQHYGKIIHENHFNRLAHLVDDALEKGARINIGGKMDKRNLVIEPVLLSQLPAESKILHEEVFGPILPILTYTDIAEVVTYLQANAKPLTLYLFSPDKKWVNHLIRSTSAGSTCVNDVLIQISNPNLPFGGVGHSGMGASHGYHGFCEFSHQRSVLLQSKLNFSKMIYPPYEQKKSFLKWIRRLM
jgi:aldehyde dehydrogenase (NAD+)